MTSNYNSAADEAQEWLDNISPTMCAAKWSQVSLHLTNGMTHSCYHPPTHKIDVSEIDSNPSALHNTQQKKQERAQMLAGERPAGCEYCWRIEDVGGRSDRVYRSGEYWAKNSYDDIIATSSTGDMNPHYVEVNFNQACNFKCSYCSPHLSTTWEKEVKEFGPYVVSKNGEPTDHNNIDSLDQAGLMPIKTAQADNPYVQAFWKWWPEMYENLEVFRMTGGEPLMDSNTFKVLDYVIEHPNAWLELSLTSNLCPPKPMLMDKFVEKLQQIEEIQIWEGKFNPHSGNNWYVAPACKNFSLFVSVDAMHKQAEYIRNGLHWKTLTQNMARVLHNTSNTTITLINTFNILSLPSFKDYLQWILDMRMVHSKQAQGIKYVQIPDNGDHSHDDYEFHPQQKIWFDVPLLRAPLWQCIQILPPEYERYLVDSIQYMEANRAKEDFVDYTGFKDFEIDKVKRNLEWMRAGQELCPQEIAEARINFAKFFDQHDARRGTNFEETFPELKEFLALCRTTSL